MSIENYFLGSRNFQLVPINAAIAEQAADLRARHRLRTPDALQSAAAIHHGCQLLLTNDATLRRVDDVRFLTLGDLLALPPS